MSLPESLWLNGRCVRIRLEGARIGAVEPAPGPAQATILPLPVEPHVHLDKAFTAGRTRATGPGLFAAIAAMEADKHNWSADDLRRRIDAAMSEAWTAGVRALRSHVDWSTPQVPLAWEVMAEVGADWSDRMPLQRASLTPLDVLAEPDTGAAIAARVARDGGVLGAFVYRHGHEEARIATVFDLAVRHGLRLDFHVDEGLEHEARAFDLIVAEAARHGMGGRVLCGHACALALRDPADLRRTAEAAARAGVALSIQPTANLFLQDMHPGRMPRLRGLAPAQELRAAGVDICLGTDNVRDAFVPFGRHDPLETLRQAWVGGQMPPADWLSAITDAPARALGLPVACITPGAAADFLILPAPDLDQAMATPGVPRQVWRRGRPAPAT